MNLTSVSPSVCKNALNLVQASVLWPVSAVKVW